MDQWACYQAKNVRRHNYEMGADLLTMVELKDQTQAEHKADRFDLGEVFLEIGLVITSLALLTRKHI